ncbi:hypothetical protein J6590_038687 [Homalodisca vitripennis]|nr:hypothetical protein J6590_038687 [Homalodisca vitripennis]
MRASGNRDSGGNREQHAAAALRASENRDSGGNRELHAAAAVTQCSGNYTLPRLLARCELVGTETVVGTENNTPRQR